jgi:LAO/AO transport system kinase
VHILDAAGFNLIIIETVGVGQGEVDIVKVADTVIVTLVPGMGDSVQTFKAGIIEIADLFVINKSDREGSDLLERDLRLLLSLGNLQEWQPKILKTVATNGVGIGEVYFAIEEHMAWITQSKQGEIRKRERLREKIRTVAVTKYLSKFSADLAKPLEDAVDRCAKRISDPYSEAEKFNA